MTMDTNNTFIHLLYVPTMACDMACRYCYLEDRTVEDADPHQPLETLRYAVEKMRAEHVIPFNISLHGGEVTTLRQEDFRALIAYIAEYYTQNRELLTSAGFTVGAPHIKTNLLGLQRHIDTIREFGVSVSGSLDLPFSLHDAYRVTKAGTPTLERILQGISLLSSLPNHKKVSATIFREHYARTDEIVRDIQFLHENTCLDMQDFNFMVGFDFNSNGLLHAMTQQEQVDFFEKIRAAFQGTDLEPGLRGAWFKEFGPEYCTNCDVCGEKFFLLERNGDVYSCVRGQKQPDFYYGNIYSSTMEQIMQTAAEKIRAVHARAGFDAECAACGYLSLCKTGCPFVKQLTGSAKSYTCELQKRLYDLWGFAKDDNNAVSVAEYICNLHPERTMEFALPRVPTGAPNLWTLIRQDPLLCALYAEDAFILDVDGTRYPLISQILRQERCCIWITPESVVRLYVKDGLFSENCPEPQNNALFIQLLSGDQIVYGDEKRTKQRHIATEMVYTDCVLANPSDFPGFAVWDLSPFLHTYGPYLSKTNANNMLFTTTALRDYHYAKQKANAFYHMQAMDLPFQNIELFYLTAEVFEHDDPAENIF